MIWTQAKAVAVLAAASTSAQGFLARLSEQVAAWVPDPTTTTTTTSGGVPQNGSPPIGGPGDGAEPSGTMIISWSTQHFTVTTGIPGGSLGYGGGTITDGGGMVMPIPTGGGGGPSQLSGAGDPASGVGGASGSPGDVDSQAGTILSNYDANVPPVLTESLGPPGASVSGDTAGGTVTDGLPGGDSPQPGSTITGEDGAKASILLGSLDIPQASVAGATAGGTVTEGGLSAGGSQPSSVADDGGTASILAGGPGNPLQASGSGGTAGGTLTDGFSSGASGGPQPGSTIADGADMASVLAGVPGNSRTASLIGPISDGGAIAPGIPRSSQPEPEPITNGSGGSRSPPAVPTGGASPAAPEALVSGATSPGESAVPSSDPFVVQLGPAGAGAGAAVSSASNRPLGRRQKDNNDHYLMNAGTEKSGDCSQATQFEIIDGELTRAGQKVSTSPGAPGAGAAGAQQQRLAVSPVVGSVTRSWVIVGGELLWLNESFVGGRAGFCEDEGTRAVFFTTGGEGGGPRVGCTPKHLTPMFGEYGGVLLASHGSFSFILLSMMLTMNPL